MNKLLAPSVKWRETVLSSATDRCYECRSDTSLGAMTVKDDGGEKPGGQEAERGEIIVQTHEALGRKLGTS
jgi:hypothetical protein